MQTKISDKLQSYFTKDYCGVMLEVGAAHPVYISNSYGFRTIEEQKKIWHTYQEHDLDWKEPEGNWDIISIEPNPEFCEEFRKNNLNILQYACADKDIGETDFYISPCPMSSSALKVRHSGDHLIINDAGGVWPTESFTKISVTALKLNTILKKHHPKLKHIDILTIDTEGWEMEVLLGFNLKKFNPKVIVTEHASEECCDYLSSAGYFYDISDNQDSFFIKK